MKIILISLFLLFLCLHLISQEYKLKLDHLKTIEPDTIKFRNNIAHPSYPMPELNYSKEKNAKPTDTIDKYLLFKGQFLNLDKEDAKTANMNKNMENIMDQAANPYTVGNDSYSSYRAALEMQKKELPMIQLFSTIPKKGMGVFQLKKKKKRRY